MIESWFKADLDQVKLTVIAETELVSKRWHEISYYYKSKYSVR